MTDTDTTINPEVIPDDIVDEDRELAAEVKRADGYMKSAKERRADAYAELNQFRWEMTVCEYGPRFSDVAYGKAVGQGKDTIRRGADAWQAVLDASETAHDAPDHSDCAYGGTPHHQPDLDMKNLTKTPPTEGQSATHDEERRKVDAGEVKAIAIEMLALHFSLAPTTVEVNYRPLVNEAVSRLRDGHDVDMMTVTDIRVALNQIAMELRQEDKLRARREDEVRRWMASNRGVPAADIKIKEIRSKMERIDEVMAKKDITWGEAATEVRESDRKYNAAAKMKNELARKARIAILDLMKAANDVKTAAIGVTKAVRAIEEDEIELSDDEREIAVGDLDHAEAAIHLARAALTGDSGTDWDAAAAAFLGKEGGE